MATPRSWHRHITAGLTIAFLAATGCSTLIQKPPLGPIASAPTVECTSSDAFPILDTGGAVLLATTGILSMAFGVQAPNCSSSPADPDCLSISDKTDYILAGLGVVGLGAYLGVSAAQGFSMTAECRQLKETQLACLSGVEASCRSLIERECPVRYSWCGSYCADTQNDVLNCGDCSYVCPVGFECVMGACQSEE